MTTAPMYSQAGLLAAVQVPAGNMGSKQIVKYQSDYIFYKAAM